jgi:hypothetical protein
MKRGR